MNQTMQQSDSAQAGRIIRPAAFNQTQAFPETRRASRNVIVFPGHSRVANMPPGSGHAGPNRPVLLILVLAAHVAILAVAVLLSVHPVAGYDPDKVIDLMNMAEMAPPPKLQPLQKPIPVTVPDAQRLQVKDENKPPVAAEPTTPATTATGDNSGNGAPDNFLPQSQLDEMPIFPDKQIKSSVVYPEMSQKMGLEALVILQLFIDQNGNIVRISVLKDPGHGFAEAAIKAFAGIKIPPVKVAGKPVAYSWRYPVRFTLK